MSFAGCALIDLAVPLGPGLSEAVPVTIDYFDHRAGGCHLASLAGVDTGELPYGLGWASERVSAITHAGTHMDAPYHYAPVCQGRPSRTIDELPLDWFWRPGVCIDATAAAEEEPVEPAEIERFEARRGCPLEVGTIVLFRTGVPPHGHPDFNERGRALAPAAVEWLTGRGIRVLGTDAWSIDPPFSRMRAAREERGHAIWGAHLVGYRAEFCVLERLCNLEQLPPDGFWLACFPIKVLRASGGWVRPVAFVPEGREEEVRP